MGEQPPIAPEPRRKKPEAERPDRDPIEANAPWKPTRYSIEVQGAAKALFQGKAEAHQQQLFLNWLIEVAAGTYDMHYHPGPDGARNTNFALGKAHVGQTVVKMIKLPIQPKRR